MIGANDVVIRDICSEVVMLVSNRLKCGCRTPEMTYCHRYAPNTDLSIWVISSALKARATLRQK
jgi:hypothetical protein